MIIFMIISFGLFVPMESSDTVHKLFSPLSLSMAYDDDFHDDDDDDGDDDDDDDDGGGGKDYQLINCDLKMILSPQLIPINQLSRPTETSERLIPIHFDDDDDKTHDHHFDHDLLTILTQ